MLRVHHSNDLDRLVDALAATIAEAPLHPFEPEIVVVPATNLSRWLALELADRHGIIANTRFVLPAGYAWELIGTVLPDVPERSPLSPESLQWRLARMLSELPDRDLFDPFDPVRHYLGDGVVGRRIELAQELAQLFERYAIERPDWVETWLDGRHVATERELGPHEAWQAALLARIARESPELPHVHPRERFFAALARDEPTRSRLPVRLSIFGLTSLPALYLDFFARLGQLVDVTFYLFNPCREYWGHIERARKIERAALEAPRLAAYLESGNRLFASLAQHGRAFFDALVALDAPGDALFIEPLGATLLANLQRDVLDLVEPPERVALTPSDRSLQIVVCHSATREAEVLHDFLLDCFRRDATLECEDILVLTPDIERDGAAIEAVFGAISGARHIPCVVADRRSLAGSPVLQAVQTLFEVVQGRLEAESVLALLELELVARRFGIGPNELPLLRDWVERLGIRWARDEADRADRGLPGERSTTWEAGLDRLIVGVALGDDQRFAGIAPFIEIEGGATELVGRLASFLDAVFALARTMHGQRTVAAWVSAWLAALDTFFAVGPYDEAELARVRQVLRGIGADARSAQFNEPIPAMPLVRMVVSAAERVARPSRFGSGGVVVADLAIGRIVPARIVCLVGLNDDTFPRRDPRRGFDLIERDPRRGDRRRREEDRYAFLSALVAARETLYLSYCGRDVHHDTERPPSVVLAELFDAIRRRACAPAVASGEADADPVAMLTTVHPLQPFSPRYGRQAGLTTFAAEWHPTTLRAVRPFADRPVREPEVEWRTLSIDDLARFFVNPARAFLRGRVGVKLVRADEPLVDHEPFGLAALAGYQSRQAIVEAMLHADRNVEDLAARLMADAIVPAGRVGEVAFAREVQSALPLWRAIEEARAGDGAPLPIDLSVGGFRLTGEITGIGTVGHVAWRVGALRARHQLETWIRHLALNASSPIRSTLYGVKKGELVSYAWRVLSARDALEHLEALLALYALGSVSPLPFFPETSFALVSDEVNNDSGDDASNFSSDDVGSYADAYGDDRGSRPDVDVFARVRSKWEGNEFAQVPPESMDPYMALAMRDRRPMFDEHFADVARAVYVPLLAARE